MKQFITLILLATLWHSHGGESKPVSSQRDVQAAKPIIQGISLAQCIRMAMGANTDIKVSAQEVIISEEEIERMRAIFDPTVEIYGNVQHGKRPSAYQDHRPRENLTTIKAHAKVTKKWSTGATMDLKGEYSLSQGDDNNILLNPLHSGKVSLTLEQPLLRGAGLYVNRAPIRIAAKARDIEHARFQQLVMNTLTEVEAAYWEFVLRYENIVDQFAVAEYAEQLLHNSRVRYEQGDLAHVDYLASQQAAAKRQIKLMEATNALIRVESKLKGLTNYQESTFGEEIPWKPRDTPRYQAVDFSLEDEIITALRTRPDYIAAKRDLEKQEIHVKVAKNALLPYLNLIGGVSAEGISGKSRPRTDAEGNTLVSPYAGDAGDLFDRMSSGDGSRWNVGVVLSFPVGRRAEKAHHVQRKAIARQAFERMMRAQRTLIREVRTSVRLIDSNHKRALQATKNRRLATTLVEKALERIRLGDGGLSGFVYQLDELAEAHIDENAALMDHVLGLTELERATGQLLKNRGIVLAPAFELTSNRRG